MNIHKRFSFRGYQLYIAFTRSRLVDGVNSLTSEGKHILMWDFDEIDSLDVVGALSRVQKRYRLANITVLKSSKRSYHAYCFQSHTWPDTLRILADTNKLDQAFFKIGVLRGYYTLRYSDKVEGKLEYAFTLAGKGLEDISPEEHTNLTKYWTKRI